MSNIDIAKFTELDVKIKYEDVLDTNADRCAEHLKHNSPPFKGKGRKYKPYHKGWAVRKGRKKGNEYYCEVWNETNYQLTHLLENGHLIVNKRGGVGWASRQPHIDKAVQYIKPILLSDMQKVDIDVEMK